MAYIGNTPAENYASFLTETFTVSATANYTLSHAVSNENDIRLVINGVVQQPGSGKAYTASGTTLTLTSATVSGDVMYAVYLGRALQTVNPPNNSVNTTQLVNSSVSATKLSVDAITGQTSQGSPADADEILVHDASASALRRFTRSDFLTGVGGTNTPAFMASLTTDQSISHNTNTKIAFANEVIDTDNTYDPSTNYRFTPGVVGKYMIGLGGWIYSSGGDIKDYSLYLFKNGSDITNTMYKNLNAFSERTNLDFHTIINVTSTSDYYEVYINQNSSGSNSVEFSASGNSAKFRNFFYAYKLIT